MLWDVVELLDEKPSQYGDVSVQWRLKTSATASRLCEGRPQAILVLFL